MRFTFRKGWVPGLYCFTVPGNALPPKAEGLSTYPPSTPGATRPLSNSMGAASLSREAPAHMAARMPMPWSLGLKLQAVVTLVPRGSRASIM